MQGTRWKLIHTIGFVVLLAATLVAALFSNMVLSWLSDPPPTSMTALWLIFMVLMGVTVVWIGYGITGVIHGFLIDPRNKMSLSRFQLILWTIVILPAFLAAALFNFRTGAGDPLNITVPPEVWGLLGISAGSLVGSAVIKSGRNNIESNQVSQRIAAAEDDSDSAASLAKVNNSEVANPEPHQASVSDLFKGELVGSQDHLDVGKVQMFFFTLLVVFAYGKDIAARFDAAGETGMRIESLPDLSAGILALLAISHAGYLANKSVPSTRENSPGA